MVVTPFVCRQSASRKHPEIFGGLLLHSALKLLTSRGDSCDLNEPEADSQRGFTHFTQEEDVTSLVNDTD